jgi:DNA-binding MarR family transcriptional regulator
MPASRFALMRLLALAEGELGVMEIARQLGVNPAAVTRQVKDLESEGLARRRPHAKDGRRNHVALSSQGKKVFAAIHQRTHELEQALSSVLGVEEMRSAALVLAKLRTFIESEGRERRGR